MKIAPVAYSSGMQHLRSSAASGFNKDTARYFDSAGTASNLPSTTAFLGTYYAMTDCHARVPMLASTLSEIERVCAADDSNEPVFFIDGGDFFGESYSFDSIGEMYAEFQKRNPDITMVFNLGNYDLSALLGWGVISQYHKAMSDVYKKMDEAGINFVNATYALELEELKNMGSNVPEFDNIKPYMVLDDVVNGKPQKVFVTGVSVSELDVKYDVIENKNAAIKYAVDAARKDGIEPAECDKTIILMHEKGKKGQKIVDYAKEELGLKNIELVIGGHPHSVDDFSDGKTRFLYPPAQGKGAYIIKSTDEGFDFAPLKLKGSGYDYSPLTENPDVIDNSDINAPYPVKEAYKKIVESPANSGFMKVVAEQSPYTLNFRNYNKKLSSPTTFGTFMANSYRDIFGADFALSRNQLLREVLPEKGKPVTRYNVSDSVNVDANIYRLNITTDELKRVFEISLQKQNTGITNSPFLEYSDNLRITRKGNAKADEDKVVQIEIFEDGAWKKLLDEDGKALYPKKVFNVVTEETLALGKIGEFQGLKFDCKKIEGATMRSTLCKALKREPDDRESFYHTSPMITV